MDCTFCNIRDFFEKASYYKQEKTLIRYIINTLSCRLYRTNVFLQWWYSLSIVILLHFEVSLRMQTCRTNFGSFGAYV